MGGIGKLQLLFLKGLGSLGSEHGTRRWFDAQEVMAAAGIGADRTVASGQEARQAEDHVRLIAQLAELSAQGDEKARVRLARLRKLPRQKGVEEVVTAARVFSTLFRRGLIERSSAAGSPTKYRLTEEGRRLVANDEASPPQAPGSGVGTRRPLSALGPDELMGWAQEYRRMAKTATTPDVRDALNRLAARFAHLAAQRSAKIPGRRNG